MKHYRVEYIKYQVYSILHSIIQHIIYVIIPLQGLVYLCRIDRALYDVEYRDVAALLGRGGDHDVLGVRQSVYIHL